MNTQENLKKIAAEAALSYVKPDTIVGVGTGSTVKYFIDALATLKHQIEGAVASSIETETLLKAHHIPIYDLNSAYTLDVYVDGADEANEHGQLIKGRGGALLREKIIATVSKKFICIIDQSKSVSLLGKIAPIPVEVIPMARSYVAREIVKLGGDPVYREAYKTDNGNIILDVFNLNTVDPLALEIQLNQITGVVDNGLFVRRPADVLLIAQSDGQVAVGTGLIS